MILCFLSALLFIPPYLPAGHYSPGVTSAFINLSFKWSWRKGKVGVTNSLVVLPWSLFKMYLIAPELLMRFYVKLQQEVMFLSAAKKQVKGFKKNKQQDLLTPAFGVACVK